MFNRRNCDQKSQLSGILIEPLNPRDIVVELRMQNCGGFLKIYLRHIQRFNSVKLLIFRAKSTFKIILFWVQLRFENSFFILLNNDDKKYKKNNTVNKFDVQEHISQFKYLQ